MVKKCEGFNLNVDELMFKLGAAQVFEYQTICREDSGYYSPSFIGLSNYGAKIVLTPVDQGISLEVSLGHFPILSLPQELNLRASIFECFLDPMIFISIGNHKIIVSYNVYVDIINEEALANELSTIEKTLMALSRFLSTLPNFEPYQPPK